MKPQLFVIALSCVGCTLQEPSLREESGLSDAAREYFDAKVYPILMARCGACHVESATPPLGFISADATVAYDSIKTTDVIGDYSTDAPLVKPVTRHFDYSPGELATMLEWLRLEREAM
jgi:hypothetical protein